MNCFYCARQIEVAQRVGFRQVCDGCGRPLHACLNCQFYEPSYNNQCRETQAERVVEKDRANFCEYFSLRQTSQGQRLAATKDARSQLEALFKKETLNPE
jgi:hypothetical protein